MLLLVRYLSPESYGIWMVIIGLALPVIMITSFGFRHSLIRFIPAVRDQEEKARFFWSVLARRFYAAGLACVALVMAFPLFGARIGIEDHYPVLLLATPTFLLLALTQYLAIALNAEFRQREVFLGSLVLQVTSLSGILLGIQWGQGLLFFAGTQVVSNGLYFLFTFWAAVRHVGRPRLRDLAAVSYTHLTLPTKA